jgi:Tol biopolymer transport system component
VNLTNFENEDSYPNWSPDGSKIAYTSFGGQFGDPEIFLMNSDGSRKVNLTNDLAEDFDPAWSPDGSQIVFSRSTGAHFHLYKMDADGSDVVQLTDLEYNDAYVAWSPDGRRSASPASTRTAPARSSRSTPMGAH